MYISDIYLVALKLYLYGNPRDKLFWQSITFGSARIAICNACSATVKYQEPKQRSRSVQKATAIF